MISWWIHIRDGKVKNTHHIALSLYMICKTKPRIKDNLNAYRMHYDGIVFGVKKKQKSYEFSC